MTDLTTLPLADLLATRDRLDAEIARRGRVRATVATCGTDSGYYRHRRMNTPACDPCRAAHAAATRARVVRKEAAA